MKDDSINRRSAVDAVLGVIPYDEYWLEQVNKAIEALPSAQSEHLCTVMERIKEKYAKAMNTPCIHNPMAWALYQVWKEYDK